MRELQRAKLSGDEILMDVVKYDKSAVLEKREKAEAEKHALMHDIIESNGTGISSDRCWQVEALDIKKVTISYRHPSHHDHEPDYDDQDLVDEPPGEPEEADTRPRVEICEDEGEEEESED